MLNLKFILLLLATSLEFSIALTLKDGDVTFINQHFKPLYLGDGDRDYYISSKVANVQDAEKKCQSIGSKFHLVTFENYAEYRKLLPYLRMFDLELVWTSGKKVEQKYEWAIPPPARPMTYTNFPLSNMLAKSALLEKQGRLVSDLPRCKNGLMTPRCNPGKCNVTLNPCETTTPPCSITEIKDCTITRPECVASCNNCTVNTRPCKVIRPTCSIITPNCTTVRPPCYTVYPPCEVTPTKLSTIVCPTPIVTCPPEETVCSPPEINCPDPIPDCPPPEVICPDCDDLEINCPEISVNCPMPSFHCPSPIVQCPPPLIECDDFIPCPIPLLPDPCPTDNPDEFIDESEEEWSSGEAEGVDGCDDCPSTGCIALRKESDFKWKLEDCSQQFHFICEGTA